MFRSLGTVIVLLVMAQIFSSAFVAFQAAIVATFQAVEVAAQKAQLELE